MLLKKSLLILFFIFVPTQIYAWGPLTHVYLGTEIFYFASLLPAGLYSMLKKYRQDFLYGNIMADTVIAKTYMPEIIHSHNWNTAFNIYEAAQTGSERAFALGYMAHLAADTVAHGEFTTGTGNLEHARLEAGVDSSLGSRYWFSALSIRPSVHKRNDRFLESVAPESVVFSHGTNRRMFKGLVALSGLNSTVGSRLKLFTSRQQADPAMEKLLTSSRERMLDVISNGELSPVLSMSPMAELKPLPFSEKTLPGA